MPVSFKEVQIFNQPAVSSAVLKASSFPISRGNFILLSFFRPSPGALFFGPRNFSSFYSYKTPQPCVLLHMHHQLMNAVPKVQLNSHFSSKPSLLLTIHVQPNKTTCFQRRIQHALFTSLLLPASSLQSTLL